MKPEDIVNQALEIIGHEQRIGSFWDGSPEAVVARDMWSETRDALLVRTQPEWAREDVPLMVSKTAPAYYDEQTPWEPALYPDMPWLYEYAQPEECLVPLALKPRAHTMPIWRPRAMRFRVKTGTNQTYVLLGNDPAPILTCIVHTHDPAIWYEDFIELMVMALSKKLERRFAPHPQERKPDANNPG
jgi:hypothetical protein